MINARVLMRLSPGARDVHNSAVSEATRLGHESVDTVHILLGIIGCYGTLPAFRFARQGISLGAARMQVEELVPQGAPGTVPSTLTPKAKTVYSRAFARADADNLRNVTIMGVLRALLGLQDEKVMVVLRQLNCDPDQLLKA
jgi:ATP-dependent Clp protease ATP-binding subunit ClpA